MEFATCPCRQGTAPCGACVEEPKYPRAMRALVEGNSIPRASATSESGSAQAAPAVTPGMVAGMTDAVWTMEVLLSYGVPRALHTWLDQ